MQCLLDMDIIVYRCGFASETKEEDGSITVDPISHCLHTVRLYVDGIILATGADSYRGFLSGSNNFRKKVDPEYKANRRDVRKPHYYEDIRNYLIKKYNVEVVDDMEADDALGLNQTDETIICSIDKDLLMIEGKHYNFVKKEFTEITHAQGTRNFYAQMLTGDTTDNIPGIKGIGPKTAEKLLTESDDWDALIRKRYEEFFGEDWFLRMKQNCLLLWIKQRNRKMPIKLR